MREQDIYRQLQRHLDRMPVPFPATESGVELRILSALFTPEQARIALALSMVPETVPAIHRRLKREMSREALDAALGEMATRGLVNRTPGPRGPRYGKAVFVVGFYEAQVNRLTKTLERDVLQYFDEAFGKALHSHRTQQMRTVPLDRTIPQPDRVVGHHDDIVATVRRSEGPFAVMPCICAQGKDLVTDPCRQTGDREHCLTIGVAARAMVKRGVGRAISREEMIDFLERADRDGLVLQPQNVIDPLFVCCCCGCCCGVLTTAKKLARPAEYFNTNYYAEADAEACDECGTCATRCQMDAVSTVKGFSTVDRDRCIGCGLCVSTCSSGAMRLVRKADERRPPKDMARLYARMYRERYGALGLAAALGRSTLGIKV